MYYYECYLYVRNKLAVHGYACRDWHHRAVNRGENQREVRMEEVRETLGGIPKYIPI